MSESMLDLIGGGERRGDRIQGVVTAVVTNNQDPENLGRVKIRFPWLSDDEESSWARVAAPAAGDSSGVYFLPDVEDEVLVVFEHGHPGFPYVIGSLWSSARNPPETNDDGNNAKRTIQTPAGHVIRLDDTQDGEKIEIIAADGATQIVLEKSGKITIESAGDMEITADGKLTLTGNGVEIDSDAAIELKADQDVTIEASGELTVKGSTVNIN
jgi:uncharacterized protein involved in type VI secretion and phage assembly